MTDEEKERHRADAIKAGAEAERLRLDPAFQFGMTETRKGLLDALAVVDATDADEIRRLQAEVKAIDLLATNMGVTIALGRQASKIAV